MQKQTQKRLTLTAVTEETNRLFLGSCWNHSANKVVDEGHHENQEEQDLSL